jgi:hypothetical protein
LNTSYTSAFDPALLIVNVTNQIKPNKQLIAGHKQITFNPSCCLKPLPEF